MLTDELTMFVQQLNQCLQITDHVQWAESVCHLYRSYTGCGVRLAKQNGETVAEVVPQTMGRAVLTLPVYRNAEQIGTVTVTGGTAPDESNAGRNVSGSGTLSEDTPKDNAFDENVRLAAGILQALFTVMLNQMLEQNQADLRRRLESVRAVINSLSFSELEAATRIAQRLDNGEALLVAARIAEEIKITRPVLVNALRKLEGAGMIETRSLGTKGTYIKMKDELLAAELGKL